jgi:hypothetical protein
LLFRTREVAITATGRGGCRATLVSTQVGLRRGASGARAEKALEIKGLCPAGHSKFIAIKP